MIHEWTWDEIMWLRNAWRDSVPASVIAAEMGITRNAVLGKVFRMRTAEGEEEWPARDTAGRFFPKQNDDGGLP